ncbi:MAG TPA: LuxR family transcriptional regulator [Kribbella sp.]|nr:LuxR family transcriptional regulator [Kribbella sp.]
MKDHPADRAAVRLSDVATELLDEAANSPNLRAARTLISGTAHRVTMIALLAGAALAEHASPPAASLQVLQGDVRLHSDQRDWPLQAGTLIAIPPQRHGVEARTDAVLLLTVAVN